MAKSIKLPNSAAAPKKAAKKKAEKPLTKKAAPEKKTKPELSINIKYTDKGAGQPELVIIFEAIKKMLEPYAGKRDLVMHGGKDGQLNLVSHKPVVIAGREKEAIWFVSALVQKGYVGFYYMPIYMNDPIKKQLSPEFLKCLKGKACFHIKKNDPAIMKEMEKAIKIGYEAFVKNGWI
ncbi:MAG: hypothetical protein RLZZ28_1858 [Bacteroidota bacterium]|jgi:hypothetical protein